MVTIKVLTANLWLLPPPSSADNDTRLDSFISIALKFDPDVINLQEVWLNKYKKYLKSKLPKYHLASPSSPFFNKSGLVTLLKAKPIKTEFHHFNLANDLNPVERIASKGYLKIQFSQGGNLFTLINTHIYQSRSAQKNHLKLEQIKEIVKAGLKHNPTIIAGDFNLHPHFFQSLLEKMHKEDKIHETYSPKNTYAHKAVNIILNKDGVYCSKPNRILANVKSKSFSIKTTPITTPLVSDHYPLLAEIKVPHGKYIKTSITRGKRILTAPTRLARRLLPI